MHSVQLPPWTAPGKLGLAPKETRPILTVQLLPWTALDKLGLAPKETRPILTVQLLPWTALGKLGLALKETCPILTVQLLPQTAHGELRPSNEQTRPIPPIQSLPCAELSKLWLATEQNSPIHSAKINPATESRIGLIDTQESGWERKTIIITTCSSPSCCIGNKRQNIDAFSKGEPFFRSHTQILRQLPANLFFDFGIFLPRRLAKRVGIEPVHAENLPVSGKEPMPTKNLESLLEGRIRVRLWRRQSPPEMSQDVLLESVRREERRDMRELDPCGAEFLVRRQRFAREEPKSFWCPVLVLRFLHRGSNRFETAFTFPQLVLELDIGTREGPGLSLQQGPDATEIERTSAQFFRNTCGSLPFGIRIGRMTREKQLERRLRREIAQRKLNASVSRFELNAGFPRRDNRSDIGRQRRIPLENRLPEKAPHIFDVVEYEQNAPFLLGAPRKGSGNFLRGRPLSFVVSVLLSI